VKDRKRIILLHVYSAANKGDGLLVREALELIRKTHEAAEIDVIAIHPDSFKGIEINRIIPVFSKAPVWSKEFLNTLRELDGYDLVFGVGGGYLRAKNLTETFKLALAHLPQLRAASKVNAIYLPQSVGPLPILLRKRVISWLSSLKFIGLRDDRSMDYGLLNARRINDMALLGAVQFNQRLINLGSDIPVISTKTKLSRRAQEKVAALAASLGAFDSFIQSEVASNNDKPNTLKLNPSRIESLDEIGSQGARVVVTVRLHAALMALHRGHFVIHLAYERKGFGAFHDLGLEDFVFSVNKFDVGKVSRLANNLLNSSDARVKYNQLLANNLPPIQANADFLKLVSSLTDAKW
jgi:polysaccharide pyruvyl transferase WcaK-like protein